jgi:hypothetical protein
MPVSSGLKYLKVSGFIVKHGMTGQTCTGFPHIAIWGRLKVEHGITRKINNETGYFR